ncbi:hypothetical protein [Pseudomonas sp. AAC]|uniref:hypothetical protein n=1 Tax=Pseudomonas sp. AAC TaxID=1502784 RepID=UPI0004D46F07|nr:hypothetical protein [Pseudomonas sp. AAC]KES23108.1 hypothetical protein FG99_16250 [Pseudomonas sp. AAC]
MDTQELKVQVLADLSDFEQKISRVLKRLPLELRDEFLSSLQRFLFDSRLCLIRIDEPLDEGVTGEGGIASGAGEKLVFRVSFTGLDDLCASALRATDGEGA